MRRPAVGSGRRVRRRMQCAPVRCDTSLCEMATRRLCGLIKPMGPERGGNRRPAQPGAEGFRPQRRAGQGPDRGVKQT